MREVSVSVGSENRQSRGVVSPVLQLVQDLCGFFPDLPGVCPDTLGELLFLLLTLLNRFSCQGHIGAVSPHVRGYSEGCHHHFCR